MMRCQTKSIPLHYELIIIGAGCAGLGAAIAAKKNGLQHILVLERSPRAGGVLPQCIHMGFGISTFQQELSGPEYALRIAEIAANLGIDILTDTSVISMDETRSVTVSSPELGFVKLSAQAVVLATGCRETALQSLLIPGTRPSGIFTAGTAQKLINESGYEIGDEVIIFGSGDIGLVMVRRLTLIGKKVIQVIERQPECSGLLRNKIQCLDEFGIPLLTSHTICEIYGNNRISGVAICPVDETYRLMLEQKTFLACDTLITALGLISNRELLDPLPSGQNRPWVFICGNAQSIHSTADEAFAHGEITGQKAAAYVLNLSSDLSAVQNVLETPPAKIKNRNDLVCGICPQSCVLSMSNGQIINAQCEKGIDYYKQELDSPRRFVTATVRMFHGGRLPVRTSAPVDRTEIPGIMNEINKIIIYKPMRCGDIIVHNISGDGADLIASYDAKWCSII